jgi:PucR family transcriptional regulator, purine catabolism regulatory protein
MINSAVPSVTLSEILQLALPAGSRVLTGSAELARRVHWARLLRARLPGLSSVEPGELLILPTGLLDALGEPRVLPRLFASLIEAGVTAFALAGEPHESVLAACRFSGTPLLQVPSGTPLADVERSIVGLILDRDAQLRRRADEIYGRLLTSMLGNAGLPALLAALSEATALRAAVFDDYLALQACAPDEEQFKRALTTAASAVLLRDVGASANRSSRPVALRFEQDDTFWQGQLYPLQIGDAWAGYLGLIGQPGQAGELDRLLADRAATLVALELAKQRAVDDATQRWRGELLDDLLDGNFPSDEVALARGQQLGYDLHSPYLTFILAADPSNVDASLPEPTAASRTRRRFADVARTVLLRHEARALAGERDGSLIVLLPLPEPEDQRDPSAERVERIRLATQKSLGAAPVTAGLGPVVTRPRDFGQSHGDAVQALAIGQKLLGGARTVDFGQLGIERLLFHLLGQPALARFATDVLGELVAYDVRHRGELVHTVEVFLNSNGNHVRAAQELHLHRNTLLYRLERAREILGRDLEHAETRLALQVALRSKGLVAAPSGDIERTTRRVASRRRRAG